MEKTITTKTIRIIAVSAILLVVVVVLSVKMLQVETEKEDTLLTWKDMQILIATPRDNITLGEGFTATVYLVNNRSEEVKMKPITSLSIEGGRDIGYGGLASTHDWTPAAGSVTILPAYSKKKLADQFFTPEQTGEFIITSLGVNKTVHVLHNESDIVEIIRLSLKIALVDKVVPYTNLFTENEEIILCTKNIVKDYVPEIDGVNLLILDLDEIQSKADKEGDLLYLSFTKLELHGDSDGIVHLDYMWMSKNGSLWPLGGGGISIEFNKESGTWNGKVISIWMS